MSNLTFERVRELFDYDEENGCLIRKFKSGKRKPCGIKPNSTGYGEVKIDWKMYKVHRVIWLWHKGTWPDGDIDHKDQNRMNNRIENLRPATRSENLHNKGLYCNNTSGYPGVSFHKQRNKYQAYIEVKRKRIYLGLFDTAEEAFLAYQLAKIQYHPTSPIAQEYLRELTLAG